MTRKTTDPIGCVPSSAAVTKALEEARRRVATLEYLLVISTGVEARLKGELPVPVPAGGAAVSLCER